MKANRGRDTGPELAVRRILHRRGLRYRVAPPVRVGAGRPIRPDLVFGPTRVVVFVDGCFWHGCPEHGERPVANAEFWETKINGNRERDARQTALLEADGWCVLRVWEHEDAENAAERIATIVSERANARSISVRRDH